jgi:hypothetical protein
MFLTYYLLSVPYIFHVKIQILGLYSLTRILIRIGLADQDPDPLWFGSLDPDPHRKQSGFTTLLFVPLFFAEESKFLILSKKITTSQF